MIAKRSTTELAGTGNKRAAWADSTDPHERLIVLEGTESPARLLQHTLASRISDGFASDAGEDVERWPRRQRLLFLIGAASALWAVTIGLAIIGAEVVGYLRG
jgi:hypothetical protein